MWSLYMNNLTEEDFRAQFSKHQKKKRKTGPE